MYSVRKTRSLSICLLMVLSTLGPIAIPVTADHMEEGPNFELRIEVDGSWEEHYQDAEPFEIAAGTYDMQIDYFSLDVGSNYTLSWSMHGINEDWGGLEGNVTSDNVTDTWQMEVSEFDCWFNVNVAIINNTDGQWDNVRSGNFDFYGECAEHGTITYSADIGGTWVSEPDEMDVGDYDMSWDVTSLTTGEEYKLDYWYYLSGQRIEFDSDRVEDGYQWVATGTDEAIDWNVSISATDCTLQPESMLWENTSSGWTVIDQYWIGQWSEVVLLPCESMLTVNWYNNGTGDWEELENLWSNNWADAGIYGDSCQEIEEDGDWYWECVDDGNNTETWDHCNYDEGAEEYWCWWDHEIIFLEPGDYEMQLVVSHLEVGSSYAMYMMWNHHGYHDSSSEDDYIEFTAPSDTLTLNQTLTIELGTCHEEFEVSLNENVTDGSWWDHFRIQEGLWMVEGPCEEPPSPFTLYYDGVEHEEIAHNMSGLEDCQEMGDGPEEGYECYIDYDGDGNWDDMMWFYDCSDDGTGWWECVEHYESPLIGEGNHSMEVEVEDLEAGTGYQLNVDVYHYEQFSSWSDHSTEEFNASSDTHSYSFTVETDNFTCGLTIHISISSDDGSWAQDSFHFMGPCEEVPSPFTLYYDGVEYEQVEHYSYWDGCDNDGGNWEHFECYVDYDGDGNWDDYGYFYGSDACEDTGAGWECLDFIEDPFLDAANHSLTLDVEGLEAGTSYGLWFNIQQHSQQNSWGEEGEELFNATSENYSSSGDLETDEYMCGLNIVIMLFENNSEDDGNWWHEVVYWENFNFHGPCEEVPSPFTLYYDDGGGNMIEYEQTPHYTSVDGCEAAGPGGDYWECWTDIDWDGDGETDWTDYRDFAECSNGTDGWECVFTYTNPFLNPGWHNGTLEVSGLDADGNYVVDGYDESCTQIDCETWWWQSQPFNESDYWTYDSQSGVWSIGWVMETDEFTCNYNVHVELWDVEWGDQDDWWYTNSRYVEDSIRFDGPCEEIPSPFTLYYDGMEYALEYNNMTGFDDCEYRIMYGDYECWTDIDWDGDGETDYTDYRYFEDCTNGTAGWECVEWYDSPFVEAGNHSGWLDVDGLDPEGSYVLEWYDTRCTRYGCEGMSGNWGGPFNESNEWDYDSASGLWTHDGYYFHTDNYTCNYGSEFRLYEVGMDEDGNWWHEDMLYEEWFNFNGPCEEIPSPFTLYIDGEEYAYDNMSFDHCQEYEDGWECWIDFDGDGEMDHHWSVLEDCSNLSTGWECVYTWESPYIEAGNHSMTLDTEVEDGISYVIEFRIDVCQKMEGCDDDWFEVTFNASSDIMGVDFYLETDNYTCNVNVHVMLEEVEWGDQDDWWRTNYLYGESFEFNGPCEDPPSPGDLYYDGVLWEQIIHYDAFDQCEEYDEFECWQDDWDYDGDGEPEHWDSRKNCEDDDGDGTWMCEGWHEDPFIDEGNHSMTWNVTLIDLDESTSYAIGWEISQCWNRMDCEDSWDETWWNDSDEYHIVDWYLETDNYTCDVSINLAIIDATDDDGDGEPDDDYSYLGQGYYHFRGPCEEPPSPVNLYYDGVMYEQIIHYTEYDLCEQQGDHYNCWMDDWGEDESDYESNCDNSTGTWMCENWHEDPSIDEGNHSMTWEIEVVEELGGTYVLSTYSYQYRSDGESEWDDQEYSWNATELVHNIDWYLETDNYTCDVQINYELMEYVDYDGDGYWDDMHYLWNDWFRFQGPCEEPPSPFTLYYDGVMYEEIENLEPWDECEQQGPDDYRCWDYDSSDDEWYNDCDYSEDDGLWYCVEHENPEITEGSHSMTLEIVELEEGANYSVQWDVWQHQVFDDYEGESEEFTQQFDATMDVEEIVWTLDIINYTCSVYVEVQLRVYDEEHGYYHWIASDGFGFQGPCEIPPMNEIILEIEVDGVMVEIEGVPLEVFADEDGDDLDPVELASYEIGAGNHSLTFTIHDLETGEFYGANYCYGEWDTDDWCDEFEFEATSESHQITFEMYVSEESCFPVVFAQLYNESGMIGIYAAVMFGPSFPECWGGGGDGWDPMMFATGIGYNTAFYGISDNGTAMVYIDQTVTLDDEFRMKVDADFGDGDGYLNQTEADEFAAMMAQGMAENDGGPDAPDDLLLNGVAASYNTTVGLLFVNLANDSMGSPQMVVGWTLHYDTGADTDGNYALSYAGEDDDEGDGDDEGGDDVFPFETILCAYTQADGYHLVYAEINGTVISEITGTDLYLSHCWTLVPGEETSPFTVTWGQIDSDGDGVGDLDDAFPDDADETTDTDADGVGDNSDAFPNDPDEYSDMDDDGVGDNSDEFPYDPTESADSDGDGWGDNSDAFPDDASEWVDTDDDGIGDNADTDADGDGIDDDAEDSDGDGVYDDQDAFPFDANETTDSDGDGVGDNGDAFPDDANETTDTDGDGIGDNSDDDADGDGQPNDVDDFPLNSGESADADGDGVGDNEDAFPNDPSEYIDSDGDGTGDNADTDDDNDGVPDTDDAFPLDDTESADTDGDGVGNNADVFPDDPYERHDSDGDGVGDNTDPFPSNPSEWSDADNDGTGDNTDAFPNDASEVVDSDGDGVGNNADAFPFDNTETADSDGDGVGDNAQAEQEPEPIEPDTDDGGLLPGFSVATSLVSMLGAAILIAGRRKD